MASVSIFRHGPSDVVEGCKPLSPTGGGQFWLGALGAGEKLNTPVGDKAGAAGDGALIPCPTFNLEGSDDSERWASV